jgi:hypothetical protein
MIIDDIKPGQQYKLNDHNSQFDGIVLTISHIQDRSVVRFVEPPFEIFGCGIDYFLKHYELVNKDKDGSF